MTVPVDDIPPDEYAYRVVENRLVTPVIRELLLMPDGEAIRFRAGQYILLYDSDGRVPPRSYSIANRPCVDGRVSLLVTVVPRGITSNWAHGLRPGDHVVLSGPYGSFIPDLCASGPLLLLGAGSGLAPLRAIADSVLQQNSRGPQHTRHVTLFFSARTRSDAIDRARFQQLSTGTADFRYILTVTRDPASLLHERIPALLPGTFADLAGWEVFTAGPPGFVAACAGCAALLGADRVHTEEFYPE